MFALKKRVVKSVVPLASINTLKDIGLQNTVTGTDHTADYQLVRDALLDKTCSTYNPNPNVTKATPCDDRDLANACGNKANELLKPLYPSGGYRRKSRQSRKSRKSRQSRSRSRRNRRR